jgi:uncharacterized protein YoaH (UPF0181 family)
MTESEFNQHYNEFHRHFNVNMNAVLSSNRLNTEDVDVMEQDLITSWIRFYVLYDIEVKVRREDFVHYNTVDTVQSHFMKKGLSREEAITTGASFLRMDQKEYSETVDYLEWFHSMK